MLGFGFFGGSHGIYNLSGDTSTLSTGTSYVGYGGRGSFSQSGGSFTTNGSRLTLGCLAGSNGSYDLSGGTLTAGSVIGGSGFSSFNFNGGTVQAGAASTSFMQGLSTANVQAGGATIDSNGFDITVAQPLLHDTTPGAAAVDGGLTKRGAGTLTLTGANTFTGDVDIDAGTLAVDTEAKLGSGKVVNVNDTGTLQFTGSATLTRTYNLGTSTLTAVSGTTLTLRNATVNGGFFAGAGTTVLSTGATLNGVRALAGSVLSQTGNAATINDSTLGGAFTQRGSLALNDVTVGNTGSLTVGGVVRATGTVLRGTTTITAGGELDVVGGTLSLTGGSVTTVNSGGTLSALSGSTIDLTGGQLVNNGRQEGALAISAGARATGNGSYAAVSVSAGGTFSAGNGVGSATAQSFSFGAGGHYDFELSTATGSFGVGTDGLKVLNTLSITAGTAAGSAFTISIDSLNLANQSAALSDFNSSLSYHWLLVDANTVTGFDSAKFTVDTSGFSNSLNGGSFSVSLNGNDLYLDFTPTAVPEPAGWALWLGAAAMGAGWRTRRRATAQG